MTTQNPLGPSTDARFGIGKRVAVVGAGFSGVCTAAHLLKRGLSVTVFERSSAPGGIWHFDGSRISEDPPYPNNKPSLGDYKVLTTAEVSNGRGLDVPNGTNKVNGYSQPSTVNGNHSSSNLDVQFSPPGPCYAGLKTNVPTTLMVSSLSPWPPGTKLSIGHNEVEQYIKQLTIDHGVGDVIHYQTRVDEVKKTSSHGPDRNKNEWEIRTVTLNGSSGRLAEKLWYFDLVVVASGHYNMPSIPDIPGLGELKSAFPDRIIHSKQYRTPERYKGQNVLVIGAGVSSLDVCREIAGLANKTYQSVRGGLFDFPVSMLPPTTVRVGEVVKFNLQDGYTQLDDDSETSTTPIPGQAVLADGTIINGIQHIVIATGYLTSYPFLSHLHSDTAPIEASGEDLIVTSDGYMAHNLYKDIFYIKDPTLAFVGIPYHVATFSLFDFQAQALARVFSGVAQLPAEQDMRREYEKRVAEKGYGRGFHSLFGPGKEVDYVNELVELVNRDIAKNGLVDESVSPMLPHSAEFLLEYDKMKVAFGDVLRKDGNLKKGLDATKLELEG